MAREVLEFVVGVTPLDQEGQDRLRQIWTNMLVPIPEAVDANEMWASCVRSGYRGILMPYWLSACVTRTETSLRTDG